MLKLIYTLFLGIMIALFLGLGVATFYPGPKPPEYPSALQYSEPTKTETTEMLEIRKQYDNQQKAYQAEFKQYNGRAFIIIMILAIIVSVISLMFETKIHTLSDGMLLGGVLTLAYSLVRAFMTDNTKSQFAAVTVGLVISLLLGYIKFTRSDSGQHR